MNRRATTPEEAGRECLRAWSALSAANLALETLADDDQDPLYAMQLKVIGGLAARYAQAMTAFLEVQKL